MIEGEKQVCKYRNQSFETDKTPNINITKKGGFILLHRLRIFKFLALLTVGPWEGREHHGRRWPYLLGDRTLMEKEEPGTMY